MVEKKYALISVSDKNGIAEFAKALLQLGYNIISTGGTAEVLKKAGVRIIPIQEITGNPESFDGRMKTISFQIESGILFDRTNEKHVKEARKLKIKPIDIVICNLYPFEQTVANPKVTIKKTTENIDVGGPTMIRAAAKNYKNVLVVVNPTDYPQITEAVKKNGAVEKLRKALAARAFQHLSFYDAQVANFLNEEDFPEEIALPGRKKITLRYGENPHQKGAVYFEPNTNSPLVSLEHLAGRELSYVNFTDIASGLESVRMFTKPAAVVIKHNSPAGIALGKTTNEALTRAVEADAESAFGGVIVLNKPLDLTTAKTFANFKEENGILVDIVAAPTVYDNAREFVRTVRKSTGIYSFGKIPKVRNNNKHYRYFDGGFVIQEWDGQTEKHFKWWNVVTHKKPTEQQMRQMQLGWKFASRIKSNTCIVVDKNLPMTRGVGSGQTSRVRATRIALEQAGNMARGAILASDSFFPFDDSVKLAAKYGIAAIVEQGGSIQDQLSIDAANSAGIVMVFTNERKFWH